MDVGEGGVSVSAEMSVVVLGDPKVGKSSVVSHFTRSSYGSAYSPTMGVDYDSAIIQVGGAHTGLVVTLF